MNIVATARLVSPDFFFYAPFGCVHAGYWVKTSISTLSSISYIIKDKPMVKYDYGMDSYQTKKPFDHVIKHGIFDSKKLSRCIWRITTTCCRSILTFLLFWFKKQYRIRSNRILWLYSRYNLTNRRLLVRSIDPNFQKDLISHDNYKLLKSLIKDLSSKQSPAQTLNLIQGLIKQLSSTNSLKHCQSSKKAYVDLLSNLWELHYSKHLVSKTINSPTFPELTIRFD